MSGNTAPVGGGIYNTGSLSVVNSTLSGNAATEVGVGGGICNNLGGTVTIENSTISGNSAYDGGGVYNNTNGRLTISNSSLSGNSAVGDYSTGGGIVNNGQLTISASSLSGNSAAHQGGGIANMGGTSSVLNSTLSGNSATSQGGGIFNNSGATLSVLNSSLSGNWAAYQGGGIYNYGTGTLANTIIANSPTGGDCLTSYGAVSADHSLVEASGANACGLTNGVAGNITGLDPLLGPLGTYGGQTQTYALLPGSPALEAGQNCLVTDQRGVSRPQPAGGACDIGAFESRGFSPDIAVLGNGLVIAAGDTTPATADATDFGSAPLAGGQITHTFTINNGGDGNLYLTGTPLVSFTGPAASDFALAGGPATPVTAGSTTTFQVRFDPGGAGSRVATVTITSNDPGKAVYDFAIQGEGLAPTVSLSVSAGSGSEAGQTQITVTATASANVAGDQTVALGVGGTGITAGDYSLSSSIITIPNGQSSGSVTFTIQDDAIDENTETASLTISNPSTGIVLGSPASQNVDIIDNDTRGVIVTASGGSTTVAEGGATDTYTLALTSQPTAEVTLTVNGSPQTEVRTGAAAYGSSLDLNFTTATWATPQTVEVRAVDDTVVEGDHSQAISHSAGGGDYGGLGIADVSAAIADNDIRYTLAAPANVTEGDTGVQTAVFTLTRTGDISHSSTVDFSLSGTAANGTDYSTVTPAPGTISFGADVTQQTITMDVTGDYVDEGDETIIVTLANATGTGGSGTGLTTGSPTTTTILDDDTAGVVVNPTSLTVSEPNTTESFTISLDSQPTAAVTITLVSADATECSVPAQVVLDETTWQSGVSVTVTAVDDIVSDGPQVCGVQTGAASSSDPNYNGRAVADVTVAVADDDIPGVILSQTGVGVGEGGPDDTYTVRLATVPTDTVTVNFTPGSQLQAIAALTFAADATALTPQTITVRAVDDAAVEGDHDDTIGHSASGGGYDGAPFTPGNSVAAAIADNDLSYALSANQAQVTEGSGSNTPVSLTVTRSGGVTTTAATASFALSGTATNGADYTNVVPAASVAFAAGETQKTITMDVVGDFRVEPDETMIVTLTGASGPGDAFITAATAQTVIDDDDTAGFTITPTSGLTTTEAEGTASFTIRLNSQPGAAVTITLASSHPAEGTVSPAVLVFTPANWANNQAVTVTGVDDLLDDGDIAYTIQTGVTSDDSDYSSLDPDDVVLTNLDNDTASYTFTPNTFSVAEGSLQVVNVILGTQPTADVTLNLSSSDPSQCTVSPGSVTLTAATWQSGVSFTVNGVNDSLSDGNQPCTIVTTVSTADSVYLNLDPSDITLMVTEWRIYLPLIFNGFATAPDLVVVNVASGGSGPSVTIHNAGNTAVTDAFWVDVYFDPNPAPPPLNRTWQSIAQAGAHWGVTATLNPGESLTLTIGGSYYVNGSSSFPANAKVYAYADSINYATTYGNVMESNEANNVFGPVVSTAGAGAVTPQVKPVSLAGLPER